MIRAEVYRFGDYECEIVICLTPEHFFQRLSRLGAIALSSGRLIWPQAGDSA